MGPPLDLPKWGVDPDSVRVARLPAGTHRDGEGSALRWIGLDIHRLSVEAAGLRDGESTVKRFRFRNTPEA